MDYLVGRGYELIKDGNSHFRLAEHDSLVITPAKNSWYWNSQNQHGTVLDFMVDYEGIYFVDAVYHLLGEDLDLPKKATKSQQFPTKKQPQAPTSSAREIPPRNDSHSRVFAYMTKTRQVAVSIVRELLNEGMKPEPLYGLYEDAEHHNAVFIRYENGEPAYCFERGTGTYLREGQKPYRHEPSWAKDKQSMWMLPGSDNSVLFVFEAIIDALSWATMEMRCGIDWRRYTKLPLGSNSLNALNHYMTAHPGEVRTIVVCTDADKGGDTAAQSIMEFYRESHRVIRCRPPCKDFNETLCAFNRREITPAEIRKIINI